jgi:hypothetical protein
VSGRDTARAHGQRPRLERGKARTARLRLEPFPRRLTTNGDAVEVKREPKVLAEVPHEVSIRIRFGAEAVMHVGACEGEAERRGQLPEHVDECHGVRAAGDGGKDAVPTENQPVAFDRREDLRREAGGGRRRTRQLDSGAATTAC